MTQDPLKPLIRGMLVMILVIAGVFAVYSLRQVVLEEQRRIEANDKAMQEKWRQEREAADRANKARLEQQMADSRAKERLIDVGAAFGELRRKAEGGDPDAQYLLGRIYVVGMQGIFIKPREGSTGMGYVSRLVQALTGVSPIGPTAKGVRYISIPVIPANLDEGYRWYERAALQGHRQAQASLGQKFLLRTDPSDGYYWMLLAAEPMSLPAEAKISDFTPEWLRTMQKHAKDRMTPEQVAETEKRAKAFQPKKERP